MLTGLETPLPITLLQDFFIFLGDSRISWRTKKQDMVSKSNSEAEYWAISTTTSEIFWLHNPLADRVFSFPLPHPIQWQSKCYQNCWHLFLSRVHQAYRGGVPYCHATLSCTHSCLALHPLPSLDYWLLKKDIHYNDVGSCCPNLWCLIHLEFRGGFSTCT